MRIGVLLALLLALAPVAHAETAQQILDQVKAVNDARQPKDVFQKGKMTIVDPGGARRIREVVIYNKNYGAGNLKSLTFFVAPAELRNVGVLAWVYPDRDDDQWIYFPETQRVRRLNATVSKDSFGDSDFSYEDSKLFSDLIRDPTKVGAATLAKPSDTIDGIPCAVNEFTPKSTDTPYSRLVMWLNRADSTLRKMELYDRADGKLLKLLTVTDFSIIDNVPTAHHLELKTVTRGSSTAIELNDIKYNQGLADDLFTQRSLQRGPS